MPVTTVAVVIVSFVFGRKDQLDLVYGFVIRLRVVHVDILS
jgi:hypothetical protein